MNIENEMNTIKQYYGDRCAARSGLPLMNHINEGVEILTDLKASEVTMKAYIIHPIVQGGVEDEVDVTWSEGYDLAVEYKHFANAYLCKPETDFVDSPEDIHRLIHEGWNRTISMECVQMLIADKVQNRKDFITHHLGTHVRSVELSRYFNKWLDYLFEMYDLVESKY